VEQKERRKQEQGESGKGSQVKKQGKSEKGENERMIEGGWTGGRVVGELWC
jgi:hypothetical protein